MLIDTSFIIYECVKKELTFFEPLALIKGMKMTDKFSQGYHIINH